MPPPPFGRLKSVNKARHVFVAPDMDVLNKKGAEKRSDDMNDDTVPDVGMTIGIDGVKIPSNSWGKCLLTAFALAALCADAEVGLVPCDASLQKLLSIESNIVSF